jgi:hypothetical protein
MKRKLTLIITVIGLLSATSCKKENEAPAFSPKGLWQGNAYLYNAAVVNKDNGSTRLYMQIPGFDTARAVEKRDGTYISGGDKYRATFISATDTFYLEALEVSPVSMRGLIVTSTGANIPYEFRKQ